MNSMFDVLIEVGKVQVTWIEAIAFVLALACVVCNVLEIHWGWPLAIVSSGLYCWLFFKTKLYGDAGIQIYFVVASLWGWWLWLKPNRRIEAGQRAMSTQDQAADDLQASTLQIRRLTARERRIVLASWLALWLLLGTLLSHFTDSDVAWADAFPTAVNISMVALLAYKSLWLTMLLYFIFLAMALLGWRRWSKALG